MRFLPAVCALTIALRLPLLALDVVPTSDFEWYFDAAKSVAAGAGFADKGQLTAFWPPGWPGFLGGFFFLFGSHVWVGQVLNLALSVAAIVLTARAARAMFPRTAAWKPAVLLIAVFPNQIAYVPLLSVEIFFEALLLLGFVLSAASAWFRAGIVFGIATLTKTQALLIPLVLSYGRVAVLTVAVAAATILPWTLRNYMVLGTPVPVATNGGYTLVTGNNPSARGGYTAGDPLVEGVSRDPANQIAADREWRDRGMRWIAENPVDFLRLVPLKIIRLWARDGEAEWLYQSGYAGYDEYQTIFRAIRWINQLYYTGVMLLAAWSLRGMWRQRRSLPAWAWSGWATMAYFTALSVVFSGQSRFHFALMPFAAIYAGYTLTRSGTGGNPPAAGH
jgi:hypothetical protein